MGRLVRIMTTSLCRNNCKYCFIKSSKNYCGMKGNWDKIKKSLDSLDYSSLEIIGGEPFHDIEILKNIFDHVSCPITFFTSGTYNQKEVLDLCMQYKDKIQFTFYFSYDGKFSHRNKDNYQEVLYWITEYKKTFAVSMRWSVNKEDIEYLFEHFIEQIELGVTNPIFFPMKYFDYETSDIELFKNKLEDILEYCLSNRINWNSILDESNTMYFTNKDKYICDDELTILPNGKFVNCYVLYSSFGYDESMVSLKPEYEVNEYFKTPNICNNCISVFNSCNKCSGNLRQYQIETGNDYYYSYCKLMNELGKIYIQKRLKFKIETIFIFSQGIEITNLIREFNGEIIRFKVGGKL